MRQPVVFVIMPFVRELEDLWQLGIRETLSDLGCICRRADALGRPGFILSQVYDEILSADLIVAEMTGQNPNVFYEVGWAHALDKPVVLCAASAEELSVFDTRAYRHVLHEGLAYVLRDKLNRIVPEVLKVSPRVPSDANVVWAWPSGDYEPAVFEWKADAARTHGQAQLDALGGQSIEAMETGVKLLRVQDTATRWNHLPGWSITRLLRRSPDLRLGDEVILSTVVRTDGEAEIEFCGDGTKSGPDGTRVWAPGFPSVTRRVSSPLWQHALFSSVIAPTKDGQDPASSGISVFMRFRTNGSIWVREVVLYRRATGPAGPPGQPLGGGQA